IAVMAKIAEGIKWDGALHTPYDQTFNETLPECLLEYLKGSCDEATAWANFYTALEKVNPDLTH
ncbi:MAG: carbohydrate ABC transporter substrate-binding protein, partial [Ruminiclostridium sp.]|nr:carbohydrate ABC transporter substrate-binding protein [Ruminiclostridium sp.]